MCSIRVRTYGEREDVQRGESRFEKRRRIDDYTATESDASKENLAEHRKGERQLERIVQLAPRCAIRVAEDSTS